jgi:hypothetical protein
MAPVRLGLRVDLRIAVDLARRGEQEAGALPLGEPERVVGAVGTGLQRMERLAEIVDRAREGSQMEDVVDRLVDLDRLDHVVVREREAVVAKVRDVRERARLEVVDADDALPLLEQVLAEMRAEKAGSAGDDRRRHEGAG